MMHSATLGAAVVLLAAGLSQAAAAADLKMGQRLATAHAASGEQACLGPGAPDLFCRHYGYKRGTANYARCWGIIAGYGPGPAVSNGYTINFDWTKTLPPRACRPPRLVVKPPENRPL